MNSNARAVAERPDQVKSELESIRTADNLHHNIYIAARQPVLSFLDRIIREVDGHILDDPVRPSLLIGCVDRKPGMCVGKISSQLDARGLPEPPRFR